MVKHESSRGDEILEMALIHLQQQHVPEFTDPYVVFPGEFETQHSDAKSPKTRPIGADVKRIYRRWFIAVGVAVAFVSGTFILIPWTSSNQVAFGQVQEAIRGLRCLKFEMKSFVGDEEAGRYKFTYSQAGSVRSDNAIESHVLNAPRKEYMIVNHSKRTAIIQPVYENDAVKERIFGPLDVLFRVQPLPTTNVRSLVLDGKPVRELTTVWDGSVAKVLVDGETRLPISILLDRGKNIDGIAIREELSQFDFDFELDHTLFAIDPPKNHEVTRMERHEPLKSSEQLILMAGEGIGPVRFGMSLQEVRKHLGDPSSFESVPGMVLDLDENGKPKFPMKYVPANPPYSIGVMHYRDHGLRIDVSSTNGVEWIRCYESSLSSKGFDGKTSHGIRIGMHKSDVMKIVDQNALLPSEHKPKLDDDHWILNGMNIDFRDNKCSVISIRIKSHIPQ